MATKYYILKPGSHQFSADGNYYTNETLDDESAIFFIGQNPVCIDHFQDYPKNPKGEAISTLEEFKELVNPKEIIPAKIITTKPISEPAEEKE